MHYSANQLLKVFNYLQVVEVIRMLSGNNEQMTAVGCQGAVVQTVSQVTRKIPEHLQSTNYATV